MKTYIINDNLKVKIALNYLTEQQVQFSYFINYTFLSIKSNTNNKIMFNGYDYVHIIEVKKLSIKQELTMNDLLSKD